MKQKSIFHLNCNPIIPECGFQCDRCVREICSSLKAKDGISKVYLTEHKNVSLIAFEYESEIITIAEIQKELELLPTFYSGKFIPEVVDI